MGAGGCQGGVPGRPRRLLIRWHVHCIGRRECKGGWRRSQPVASALSWSAGRQHRRRQANAKTKGWPMWTWLKRSIIAVVAVAALVGAAGGAMAAEKKSFKIAWSIYVGWMPWPYAQESGILTKWAEKYGISIDLVQINDYVESINQYTAGAFDGVVVTNMDCLTIPSAGRVDTTSIILGHYSNGHDAVILKSVRILPKKKPLPRIARPNAHPLPLPAPPSPPPPPL